MMPNSIIKSFAEKSNKSIEEVEKLYEKSKKIVADEYTEVKKDSKDNEKWEIGVLKKMLGINEEATVTTVSIGDYKHAKKIGKLVKRKIELDEAFYMYFREVLLNK